MKRVSVWPIITSWCLCCMNMQTLTGWGAGTVMTKTTKLVRWEEVHWTWVSLMITGSTPLYDHAPVWLAPPLKLKKAQRNCFTLPGGTWRSCASFYTQKWKWDNTVSTQHYWMNLCSDIFQADAHAMYSSRRTSSAPEGLDGYRSLHQLTYKQSIADKGLRRQNMWATSILYLMGDSLKATTL